MIVDTKDSGSFVGSLILNMLFGLLTTPFLVLLLVFPVSFTVLYALFFRWDDAHKFLNEMIKCDSSSYSAED